MKKVLVVVIILLIGGIPACDDDRTYYVVEYKVVGTTSSASLTYANAQGGTEQVDVQLPWKRYIGAVKRGAFLYLSVQNNEEWGSIICVILVDGQDWRQSTSIGAYVIATCSGLVGSP